MMPNRDRGIFALCFYLPIGCAACTGPSLPSSAAQRYRLDSRCLRFPSVLPPDAAPADRQPRRVIHDLRSPYRPLQLKCVYWPTARWARSTELATKSTCAERAFSPGLPRCDEWASVLRRGVLKLARLARMARQRRALTLSDHQRPSAESLAARQAAGSRVTEA